MYHRSCLKDTNAPVQRALNITRRARLLYGLTLFGLLGGTRGAGLPLWLRSSYT